MSKFNKIKGSILLRNGIDVSQPAEYIDDQSVRNSINFDIDRNLITKRVGESQVGLAISTTDDIMAGRVFERANTKYNVRIGLDKVEYLSGTTWTNITGTDLTGTATDLIDTAVPLLSGASILCFTNGKDAIRKWTTTGNTAALGGTPPVAKFIQEYRDYLVCANILGGTDIPERVQWCDTAAPETWTGGNSGSVDLVQDNEPITGLNVFGDYLAIHKKNSIWLGYLVSSSDIFRFDRKSTGAGTVANASIVNLPTGHQAFLASDGIRIFNGITAPLIDSRVNDEIRDELNAQYSDRSFAILVKERDEVWFGIPLGSQTSGETIYKYNYNTGAVLKDYRPNTTTMWLGESSNSTSWQSYDGLSVTWDDMTRRWNERTFDSGSVQINIGKSNGVNTKVDYIVRTDNSTAINAYFVTKDFQDSQNSVSRWKRMELWAKGDTVKVEYSTDAGITWIEASESPYTLTNEFPDYDNPLIVYFDVIATKIRFRFTNAESNENLTIKQFTLEYISRENRR